MEEIWKRIEDWLSVNAPHIYNDLRPGATEDEIKETEEYFKISFPEDVKASLRLHNGQLGEEGKWLVDGWELLSLERMMEEWDFWDDLVSSGNFEEVRSKPEPEIRDDWWNPKWVPITGSGANDYYCLDFAPTGVGNKGQVIILWHDMPSRELVATDYKTWLNKFATDLENGKYIVAEEYDGLVLKDDAE